MIKLLKYVNLPDTLTWSKNFKISFTIYSIGTMFHSLKMDYVWPYLFNYIFIWVLVGNLEKASLYPPQIILEQFGLHLGDGPHFTPFFCPKWTEMITWFIWSKILTYRNVHMWTAWSICEKLWGSSTPPDFQHPLHVSSWSFGIQMQNLSHIKWLISFFKKGKK